MSAYRTEHTAYEQEAVLLDDDLYNQVDFLGTEEWDIPTPVTFQVTGDLAPSTDLPLLSVPLLVVSRRLADALVALGGFEYSLYDVQLVDGSGSPVGTVGDFVIFQVRTVLDVLDRENADIDDSEADDPLVEGLIFVDQLAIVRPSGGLPACFRVEHAEEFLLVVNEDGKAALDALGPRGFTLVEVPTRDEIPPLA